jgi:hypothetical protein
MAEAAHLSFDGKARYGWTSKSRSSQCKYLTVDGVEVTVICVSSNPIDSGIIISDAVCIGEVVACTSDINGNPQRVPDKVKAWLLARKHGVPLFDQQIMKAPIKQRQESPCPVCTRMNDLGSKKCWHCELPNPVG